MSATEINKKIDYKTTNIENRLDLVNKIVSEEKISDYFDDRFKVNLTSNDNLSEHDPICNSLERLANYLLNSDEVKEGKKDKDFEYKFYSDEESFNKAIKKEPKIDGMGSETGKENVIHFLKKENKNFKKSKNQRITRKDLEREDELGHILRSYTDYLEKIKIELNNFNESKLSRFKLSSISGSVSDDMIMAKDMLLGTFGYKTNAEESTVIDWDQIDFTNHKHSRALLYIEPGRRADEDLMYIVEDFTNLVREAKPTKLQKEIIELMRKNKGTTDIGNELNIPKQNVEKNINMLVKRIAKVAGRI
jgi:hypothetical protein